MHEGGGGLPSHPTGPTTTGVLGTFLSSLRRGHFTDNYKAGSADDFQIFRCIFLVKNSRDLSRMSFAVGVQVNICRDHLFIEANTMPLLSSVFYMCTYHLCFWDYGVIWLSRSVLVCSLLSASIFVDYIFTGSKGFSALDIGRECFGRSMLNPSILVCYIC